MLINTNHPATDQRTGESRGPTEHPTPPHRRPYWNETIAAFSDSVWLPTGTAAHNAAINRAHGWASKTAAHSWFSTNRIAAPNPDLPKLYSPAAVQDTATRGHRWRHQATGTPDTGLSRPHPEAGYRHLADRQPLDLQPHRRDPAVRHSGRMETHRQHGNAGSQSAASRMGFGSLPGEAHRSEGRLPRHVQRQNLQPGTQGQPDTRPAEPTKQFAQLGYRSRQNPKQSCYIPDDAVTEHGVYHTMLGPLRMAEAIPAEHKECRLVQERGLYWLIVPYPAQCDIEDPKR